MHSREPALPLVIWGPCGQLPKWCVRRGDPNTTLYFVTSMANSLWGAFIGVQHPKANVYTRRLLHPPTKKCRRTSKVGRGRASRRKVRDRGGPDGGAPRALRLAGGLPEGPGATPGNAKR